LSIFKNENREKTLYSSTNFTVFVYDTSIPLLNSKKGDEKKLESFLQRAKDMGILVYSPGPIDEANIPDMRIDGILDKFYKEYKGKSDYIVLWGEKEFLFSIISKLNQESSDATTSRKLNFVMLSTFNPDILKGYLSNLVSNKNYIKEILLLDDSLAYKVLNSPQNISELETLLTKNEFTYEKLDTKEYIPWYLFISRFVNDLSNSGITTSDIYILIMIPFLLTAISFIKHFVGFSPIGIALPLFFSLLAFKLGIIFFVSVLVLTFLINLILATFISRYNLLYTPKIIFLTIINLTFFIGVFTFASENDLVKFSATDAIYIILYIILSEKLINVITSKEFKEYKKSLYSTFIIGLFGYLLLQIDSFRVFLLAYPEVILLLIPLNFLMGKFT